MSSNTNTYIPIREKIVHFECNRFDLFENIQDCKYKKIYLKSNDHLYEYILTLMIKPQGFFFFFR